MFQSKCWFSVILKTDARKGHVCNGCTQGSFEVRMRATRIEGCFDGCTHCDRLLSNGYAQGMDQIPDARNLHPAFFVCHHALHTAWREAKLL